MIHSVKLAWGINLNGDIKHISEVPNGNKCQCVCIECGGALCANQGEIKTWYFSHQTETNCTGESIIHFLAKKIIENASKKSERIHFPSLKGEEGSYCDLEEWHVEHWQYKNLFLSNYTAKLEVKIDNLIVDVLCTDNITGQAFAIEIYRTNKKDDAAASKFEQNKLMSIEIDLSEVSLDISRHQLEEHVLKRAPRKWIFNTEHAQLKTKAIEKLKKEINSINAKNYNNFLNHSKSIDTCHWAKRIQIPDLKHEEKSSDYVGNVIEHKCSEPLKITNLTTPLDFDSEKRVAHAMAEINHKAWYDIFYVLGYETDFSYNTPKPHIIAIVEIDDNNNYSSICKMINIEKWKNKLKLRTQMELANKINSMNEYKQSFSNRTDVEKILYLCSKLNISPPDLSAKSTHIKPYWNVSDYVWKMMIYIHHICRYERINCDYISKNKSLKGLFNFPDDDYSRVKRSKDIYFWLRDTMAPKGLVSHSYRLHFDINKNSNLKNKINTIFDLF